MLKAGYALPAEAAYPAATMSSTSRRPESCPHTYWALSLPDSVNPPGPVHVPDPFKREQPDSQELFVSAVSSSFTAPTLVSSSSNVSNSTAADTEFTSPSSTTAPSNQTQPIERVVLPLTTQARARDAQPHAPRVDTSALRTGNTAASPMSIDSPVLALGSKRTATGSVKSAGLTVDTVEASPVGHKRTKSESNSRIGELSAQLRTRLSYAMVKVQNGWEKQSLEELEDHTSQRGSPVSVHARSEGSRPPLESPLIADRRRRPSGVSENSDQIMFSPSQSSPPSVSRSSAATPSAYWRSAPQSQMAMMGNGTSANVGNGIVLAAPAEIGPRRKRRSSASHAPPPLLSSSQRKHYSDLGTTPRTPTTAPRAGILRMPSQQAEKDAVDTLLFMSSPNNSGRLAHTSMDAQAQLSSLRSEVAGPRRVMFENQSIKEKFMEGHKQIQGPNAQHATFH
ncbi:hypothetical protein CC78DRAFT_538235, partial [Lojkania enalia]